MLLPEAMSRIVIVGSKSRIDEAIDALYGLEMIHLIDYTTGTDEGFAIGAPRPYSGKASERLLSLRAMENQLGVDTNKESVDKMSAADARDKINSNCVESTGEEVFKVLDRKNEIVQKISEEEARKNELLLLGGIPIPLELYKGYETITSLIGTVGSDPTEQLSGLADSELFISTEKKAKTSTIVLFVRKSERENALRVLADFEFTELPALSGEGSVADNLAASEAKIASLNSELASIEEQIASLKEKHGANIKALDEELSFDVSKGEMPLRIATSEYSYVIDAWVPTAKVAEVNAELARTLGDGVYMELQEDRSRDLHEEEKAEARFKQVPTKMTNGKYVEKFEYVVQIVDTPKYQEMDPSIILAIFFPLFFGFMVGDIGYAIPFMILGAYGLKVAKNKDWRLIATALFFGGIWAFIFGFFLFGDFFGMHFVGHFDPDVDVAPTWEWLLGVHLPDWFTGIFPDHGHGISKLEAVPMLLKLSVYIGIMHMMLGLVIGFINVKMQHGFKEAFFEKGGWMFLLSGLVMACWAMTEVMISGKDMEGMILYMLVLGLVLLVAGLAVASRKEGPICIMEVPGMFGNILSYTRIAAVGASKAGMAMAFNYISIVMIAGSLGGIIGMVVGVLMFSFLHLVIFVLAILSAGLQSVRLHYVEMMSKFFVGGGKDYEPLTIKRINTKNVETEV